MTKLLTITEAAEALSLSQNTVRALCARRKLRHERHGLGRGTIRIPEDALDEYRASVTVQAGERSIAAPPASLPVRRRLSLD